MTAELFELVDRWRYLGGGCVSAGQCYDGDRACLCVGCQRYRECATELENLVREPG